jgi:hypothetical protein
MEITMLDDDLGKAYAVLKEEENYGVAVEFGSVMEGRPKLLKVNLQRRFGILKVSERGTIITSDREELFNRLVCYIEGAVLFFKQYSEGWMTLPEVLLKPSFSVTDRYGYKK